MFIQKIKRKKGFVYRAHVKGHGLRKARTFNRKYDAMQWAQKVESTLCYGVKPEITFVELAEEWMEKHSKVRNAPRTYLDYKEKIKYIYPVLGNIKADRVTYSHIENLVPALLKSGPKKNKSLNRYLGLVRTIFNYGIRKGYLHNNPVKKEHFLKEDQELFNYWSIDEANKFIAHAEEKYSHSKRHVLLIYKIALNTGMRWGEIIALKWDAVRLGTRSYIVVKRTFCSRSRQIRETTKGGHIRYIGINEVLKKALIEAKQQYKGSELVIPSQQGTAIDGQNFTKRHFKPDIREAGVSEIRFHDTRHTYASMFMMNGGNLFDLQKILGHQSLQMTQRYAHLAKDYILDKSNVVVIGKSDNVIEVNFKAK